MHAKLFSATKKPNNIQTTTTTTSRPGKPTPRTHATYQPCCFVEDTLWMRNQPHKKKLTAVDNYNTRKKTPEVRREGVR